MCYLPTYVSFVEVNFCCFWALFVNILEDYMIKTSDDFTLNVKL